MSHPISLPAQAGQGATKTSDTATSDLSTGEAFSPMNFGATGDGVADDRTAVIAAIDAAIAAGGYVDGGDRLYGSNGIIHYTGVTRPWIKRLRPGPGATSATLQFPWTGYAQPLSLGPVVLRIAREDAIRLPRTQAGWDSSHVQSDIATRQDFARLLEAAGNRKHRTTRMITLGRFASL